MAYPSTSTTFGDAITVNNDDDVEDEGMNGASISGPPGLETHNLRSAAIAPDLTETSITVRLAAVELSGVGTATTKTVSSN